MEQKGVKHPVVSFTDTGPNPSAVMVVLIDAVVAHRAVGGSWWPEYVACLAEF